MTRMSGRPAPGVSMPRAWMMPEKTSASVMFRPGPLSGRDDKVQQVGAWALRQMGVGV